MSEIKTQGGLYVVGNKQIGNAEAIGSHISPRSLPRRSATARNRDQTRSTTGSTTLKFTHNNLKNREMVKECLTAYRKIGIVRNVVDMMSDFASEGVSLVHTNKTVQNFWNKWLQKIKIEDRTERIANTILKAGTCVIRRREGVLSSKEEKKMKNSASAARRIPIGYTIINPEVIDITGVRADGTPEIVIAFSKKEQFGIAVKERKVINDDSKNYIATYKKDDWELWAAPFHFAVLDDLALENKMQRMDEAAIDGVINNIRIWKLGGELKDGTPILPTPEATAKLASILQNDMGGGVLDIIWDQFIDLQVEYPPVDKILDYKKYEHVRKRILEGFGIAQVLIDGTGQGSYSNQYLSVRSLIEKIEYIRNILTDWLKREVEYVSQQMGFKRLPDIEFKHIDLGDEVTRLSLLMQLFDRNIISKEAMLSSVEHNWEVEKSRLNNESVEEESDNSVQNKVGPYSATDEEVEKIENKEGGDGRPANQPQEKTQKKKRNTKPKGSEAIDFSSFTNLILDAEELIDKVEAQINPSFLEKEGVTSVKKLTKDKKADLKNLKFSVFASIQKDAAIDSDYIKKFSNSDVTEMETKTRDCYAKLLSNYRKKNGDPNLGQLKKLQAVAWAMVRS